MPFLAYELTALEDAAHVARHAGIAEDTAIAGNLRVWRHCWTKKTDMVTADQLAGFYGSVHVVKPLAAFGFIEPSTPTLYRVRGAERYLRIRKARSDGGKAASGNLRRGTEPGPVAKSAGSEPGIEPGSAPALPLSIEHRTLSKQTSSSGAGFFARVQETRRAHGFVTEKEPNPDRLSRWFSEALMELNGDEGRLWGAYEHFADDPHWKDSRPPWPFAAFAKNWRNHVRQQPAA